MPIDGTGDRAVGLPGEVSLPAIVHAKYAGTKNFVVRGIDASGDDTQILAVANGAYDGTFPVGFVETCGQPTVALHVETTGHWHLDITEARNAPRFAKGVAGRGDAVFVYTGSATPARVAFHGRTRFILSAYGAAGAAVLAQADKTTAYNARVNLPKGPVFVAVTADGTWSLQPTT